jgi:hypothetical protein
VQYCSRIDQQLAAVGLGDGAALVPERSVAKGPKLRQSSKRAEKNCVGPEKSGAELLPNLSKKGRKGAELFYVWFFIKSSIFTPKN